MWSRRDAHALRTGHKRRGSDGGDAESRQGGPAPTLVRSIVTETNASPEFFAQNQTHVDLDAALTQVSSLIQIGR